MVGAQRFVHLFPAVEGKLVFNPIYRGNLLDRDLPTRGNFREMKI